VIAYILYDRVHILSRLRIIYHLQTFSLSQCACVHMFIFMYPGGRLFLRCIYVYVCIYVYIYVCIYTYVCIYIYMYMQKCVCVYIGIVWIQLYNSPEEGRNCRNVELVLNIVFSYTSVDLFLATLESLQRHYRFRYSLPINSISTLIGIAHCVTPNALGQFLATHSI